MLLGIDIGTSAVKACLMAPDGTAEDFRSVALSTSHPHPGWSEQDPEAWWQAVVSAVRALLAARPDAVPAVAGIGLSGQMHGAVLLDRDDRVLRPAILWNDGRAAHHCAVLDTNRPDLAEIAGVRPMPGFTAPKLAWLAECEPEVHAQVARVLLPKDHVGLRLHGRAATDPSDAAGTFWFDQGARAWSEALCAATATDPAWLPEVIDGSAVAGTLRPEAAAELGLAPGLPVATGAGDAAAGAVGIGAVADGAGFVSLGTSGQLFLATSAYRAAPEGGLHSFAHTLPGLWFQMAAMLNGARPMGWFAGVAGREVGDLLEAAAGVPPARAPLMLPYLTGERTPHGDAAIRGAFYGLSDDTGAPEMMRGVVDAIAYSFADAAATVAAATPLPDRLLAIGGGARSDLVLQTLADVLDIRIARTADAGIGPALGAARLAAVAAGLAEPASLAVTPPVAQVFAPRPEQAAHHEARLAAYRALYQALKPLRGTAG